MPEFLKAWAMSLSGIIVFGSVFEMILPSGVYKKYIHLAIGLILILALIRPFTDKEVKLETDFFEADTAYAMSNSMEDCERKEIVRIYKNKLCDKMKNDITEFAGVEFEIKCDIHETEEKFGEIESVYIIVDAKNGVKINEGALELLCKNYGIEREDIIVKYIS